MDIIVDTNVLRQDHLLRSPRFKVILDYLQKTDSHLVIPQVSKDEMVALFRRNLIQLADKARKTSADISLWCYDGEPKIDFQ